MNYSETLDYIYKRMPMFQVVGTSAYKEGLEGILAFAEHLGNPQNKFKTIHVGGTNGKGSVSHTLASVLQSAGYKVGLFTSPHLRDFRERIRVNGEVIPEQCVIEFVERNKQIFDVIYPSFFEVCVGMAFEYFAKEKVDVAVIEVGLGGRLDSTNIISPDLSVITNISFDHVAILGDTLEKIAVEKAGIIKRNTPVVIGEAEGEIKNIFKQKAESVSAPIRFAEDTFILGVGNQSVENGTIYQEYRTNSYRLDVKDFGTIRTPLLGECQKFNMCTVVTALRTLQSLGYSITDEQVKEGIEKTVEQTHLMGRWQILQHKPFIVCDTGHNVGGLTLVTNQIKKVRKDKKTLRIVFGMVSDKDVDHVMPLLPTDAVYYFTRASIDRAMPEDIVKEKAAPYGLLGNTYHTVAEALEAAKKDADDDDMIFVGGSSYVVAEIV